MFDFIVKMAAESAILSLVDRLADISLDSKTEALEELRTVIAALPPSQLRSILPNISTSNVFHCLNTQNKYVSVYVRIKNSKSYSLIEGLHSIVG